MGEFRDKYTNSTNIPDILFFVYVKNSPIILGNAGGFLEKKMGGKANPPTLDQTLHVHQRDAVTTKSSSLQAGSTDQQKRLLTTFCAKYFEILTKI